MKKQTKFIELKEIFRKLHGENGCLWDKKQTHRSLIRHLREEAREFILAVNKKNYQNMKEELGDVLLQVMFHAQIASKVGRFDIEDVIEGLIKKLKRRHPHVFGNARIKSTRQIILNWNKIKILEKKRKYGRISFHQKLKR